MSKLSITGAPPNWLVEVDGKPIPAMSVDLHMDCESLPELAIRLLVLDVDVDTEVSVRIDERTAAALVTLGWTPPADGDGHKPEMSDVEFDRRLAKWMRVNPGEFDAYLARQARIQGTRITGR